MAITTATQLGIYNGALRRMRSRKIASLSEDREPRRVLDSIWDSERVVREALERADWNFGLKSTKETYDPSVETEFGFQYVFSKPTDLARMSAVSSDEYFQYPLTNMEFADENDFWLSTHPTIYVRYVSNGTDYGTDDTKWTEGFRTYLECKMAWEAVGRITNADVDEARLERMMDRCLKEAKSTDAMMEGVKVRPPGSWVRSRAGSRYDRDTRR